MKIISNILGWMAVLNIPIGIGAMKEVFPESVLIFSISFAALHYIYCGVRGEGIFYGG